MTINKTEKLNLFFEQIRTVGFLGRIFSWAKIRDNSIEAYEQYRALISEQEKLHTLASKSENLLKELSEKKIETDSLRKRIEEKESEFGRINESNHNLQENIQKLNFVISGLKGELAQQQQIIEQQQNTLGQLEEAKKQLMKSVLEHKEVIAARAGELNLLNKEIIAREAELGKYISLNGSSQEKISELQREIESFRARAIVLNEEVIKLKKESGALEESLEQKRNHILEFEKEISAWQEKEKANNSRLQELQKEIGRFSETIEHNNQKISSLNQLIAGQNQDLKHLHEDLKEKSKELAKVSEAEVQCLNRIKELENEKAVLKNNIDYANQEKARLSRTIATFEENEAKLKEEYKAKTDKLQIMIEQLETEKEKVQEERRQEIRERFEKMKKAWKNHEEMVQRTIMDIAQRYGIEYIEKEKLPFKGKPDNVLRIADEYIVFDAKCPMTEDLENFPKYIESQVEQLKKYVKEDDVKKDLFLVVPSNTIITDDDGNRKGIRSFYYQMSDYRVFVVAIDSLEPIIVNLKKIEQYEFAEKMSPEDRENICSIIAKFVHLTKRKVQIDSFINENIISILKSCGNLPEDFTEAILEKEKSEKLNPPMERRGKKIPMKDLEKNIRLGNDLAESEEINLQKDSINTINLIPLHK